MSEERADWKGGPAPKILFHHWLAVSILLGFQTLFEPALAQPFRALLGAEEGRIYAIQSDGVFRFYRYYPENGGTTWLNASGPVIGGGWQDFEHVAYNGNGILYAATSDGRLLYYRDLARNGTFSYEDGGPGADISPDNRWAEYKWVLGNGDGIIYAIDAAGDLWFYQHLTQDRNNNWRHGGVRQLIGNGWNKFKRVFSGRNGVLYGIDWLGNLFYYRDLARDGTANWERSGGLKLPDVGPSDFWANSPFVFSTGNGNIYAVRTDGHIEFFHVTISNLGNGAIWVTNNAQIGPDGPVLTPELLEGYCWPLSASPGGTISFMVSGKGRSDVTFFRHTADISGVVSVPMGSTTFTPTNQAPPPWNASEVGCGWTNSFTWTIPPNMVSGIYSARCRYGDGSECHMTFVVKPGLGAQRSCVAFVTSVNTSLAYNNWGGPSKYDGHARQSFLRPHPFASPVDESVSALDETRADLWILGFLESAGYTPDVYTDIDFHNDIFTRYRCLVLGSHPEYWTTQMYDNLERSLQSGVCLLYLGGNGIFESAEYKSDQTGMIFLTGVDCTSGGCSKCRFSPGSFPALFRNLTPAKPEAALLGIGFIADVGDLAADGNCYNSGFLSDDMLGAPYQVRNWHPFFNGTTLRVGDFFGDFSLNNAPQRGGKASGWEVDNTAAPGIPAGRPTFILASSTNGRIGSSESYLGAEMGYYVHSGGGFVLSAGSVTFGGSLPVDSDIQQIMRNALAEACAPLPTLDVPLFWVSSNGIAINVHGRFNARYVLQSSSTLVANDWTNETTLKLSSNVVQAVTVSVSGSQRFYRVMQLP